MALFFSARTIGFYDDTIHEVMPDDVVRITEEEHAALMAAQSAGKVIAAKRNGTPEAIEPPSPTEEEAAIIREARRLQAYRDEADPLFFKWQRGECTKSDWINKVEEIKALIQ